MIQLIAEIGQAHNGRIEKAHKYIEAVSKTGVTAIKFQTHIAEAESSIYEPFRIKFSTQDKTRFEYWKRMEFSLSQWRALKEHCDEVNLEFMSSPFSNAAVDLLEKVGIKRYKIGSGEVNNFVLLEKIALTKKPIILSSGMSSFKELDKSVAFLKQRKASFSIMQCTTDYPTKPIQYGLNVIQELKDRYNVVVGFSDHSAKIETCIAAATLGAQIIEFHVILDENEKGPDAKSSLTIDETRNLVKAVRNIDKALQHPIDKNRNEQYSDLKQIFEKSLAINKDLEKGHIITFSDLEAKKPKGYGILAKDFKQIIGKRIKSDMNKWDFLTSNDIQ